ncbi:MAG: BMP family ABC transporter substrate-binding protein [Lachnospiraceae bacterium]|nr:BMP family ABC transporter substrate-binding protein [Lachnospiraceae bacterium]
MKGKRLVKSIAIMSLAFLLAGCGSAYDETQVVRIWEDEESILDETGDVAQKGKKLAIRVGMTADEGAGNDNSYIAGAELGLKEIENAMGAPTVLVETPSIEQYAESFEKLVEQGCDLSWGIGFNCQSALIESAALHPDKSFAIVDCSFEDTPDNVTGVVFRAQEPSFLVGYIAGATTASGKVGFVGGESSEVIDQFRYGFEAGVKYAANIYSKNVDISVAYADSFLDQERGKELAKQMYQSGCDIVYQAAGLTGNGVILAAQEEGKFVIGVDQDQSGLAPDNVLTSAIKKTDVAVINVTRSFINGEQIGGRTFSLGLTEGAVGIPVDHHNYRDEIYDAVLRLEDDIKSGKIIPPDSERAMNAFLLENGME